VVFGFDKFSVLRMMQHSMQPSSAAHSIASVEREAVVAHSCFDFGGRTVG